ncbi:TATA box-binding protein-associated factor RNA polymerase I subunit B isoform X1 [Athalia rosae]|uniref:TATA box-binding protein-associated factor RNA polymerase I subunit B isoform X1 n=1 Tax=Athalia rosae TaxID=37344 RepID=UPI0020335E1D|nr:TATA box-binding protein-associated factor RNA polymerase I subunit B isoform X1 [Athalia rosae]
MNNCAVCGGTEFYNEAGFFFCTECQTQNEEKRDGILDLRVDGIRVTKRKLPNNNLEKADQETQWTTWEQYNFILIGLTNELIELGATSDLKLTVLQLWAAYLQKEEVAFTSTVQREIPKLARSFHKKDADIIYGKLKARRKKCRRANSTSSIVSSLTSGASSNRELSRRKMLMVRSEYDKFALSQEASGSDALSLVNQSLHCIRSSGRSVTFERLKYSKHAKMEEKKVKQLSKKLPASKRKRYQKNHVTTKYRTGPHVITPIKLWAILYLALRIHNQNIHLADILRYGREGHLSYYRLDHLLPAEMQLTDNDVKLLTQNNEITHKGMRRTSAELAKYLSVYEIYCPDFIMLIERYCKDLNLPKGILLYAQRLIALSPPKMIFNKLEPLIPNYEGRAMAYIVVVVKILFSMDGITEYEMSRIAEKINSEAIGDLNFKLFSFSEWQRYIECRRNVLTCKHFPTKYKNDSDALGNSEVYVKFIQSALSKREEKIEARSSKNTIPILLAGIMEQCASTLVDSNQHPEHIEIFSPSLSPQQSYLEQLLENPLYDLPHILWTNFGETEVYYSIEPNEIEKCAASYGITLKFVNSRLHFMEKLVPQFQRSKMPTLTEWNTPVTVMRCNDENKLSADGVKDLFFDSEEENFQRFELITPNQLYYDNLQDTLVTANKKKDQGPREKSSVQSFGLKKSDAETFDFGFQDVTSEGKLQIPAENDSDSDNESTVKDHENNNTSKTQKNFHDKYNLHLPDCYSTDVEPFQGENLHNQMYPSTVSGKKGKFIRDSRGRFVREDSSNVREEPKIYKSPRIIMPWSKNSDLPNSVQKNKISYSQSSSYPDKASVLKCNDDTAERFFIPSKDYWMYHCVFSHIKPKNFELFESELPVSFQWLLSECADAVEMSTEDLYEQVCLIETYCAHVLSPNTFSEYFPNSKENRTKIQQTKKKW